MTATTPTSLFISKQQSNIALSDFFLNQCILRSDKNASSILDCTYTIPWSEASPRAVVGGATSAVLHAIGRVQGASKTVASAIPTIPGAFSASAVAFVGAVFRVAGRAGIWAITVA